MYQIVINERQYELKLYSNDTAEDVKKMLPLNLSMQPYSNIEYYGELNELPKYDNEYASTMAKCGTLVYCLEYRALVLVCKNHKDIFREIPVGVIQGDVSWLSEYIGKVKVEIREV